MYMNEEREKRLLEIHLYKAIRQLLGKRLTKQGLFHHEIWLVEDDIKGTMLEGNLFEWCASPLIVSGVSYHDKSSGHVYTVAHIYCYGPDPYVILMKDDVIKGIRGNE